MPRNILIIFLLILALFALGVTTFYLTLKEKGERMEKEERVETLPEEPVVESQEPTTAEAIDTSDWKVYRDEELGIAFKYPKEWGEVSGFEFRGKDARMCTFPRTRMGDWLMFVKKDLKVEKNIEKLCKEDLPFANSILLDSILLDCRKIQLSNGQEGIKKDELLCHGSPTGGEPVCDFVRSFIVDTKNKEYPTLIGVKYWEEKSCRGRYGIFECGPDDIPCLLKEYEFCKKRNKRIINIFDNFIKEIQLYEPTRVK